MDAFHQLQAEYSNCQRCPALCESRTKVVFGSGNPQAEILFLGEAPGFQEDKQGIPFCGESGKILQELLASISLTREEVFITNTILCRPENNRNPAPEEVQNCSERLDALIKIMQPKVIVTIGNFATQRILGKAGAGKIGLSVGITSLRGKVFNIVLHDKEIKVIPVIHPANYLYNGRNPQLFEQMKGDFQCIREQIKNDLEKVKGVGMEEVSLVDLEKVKEVSSVDLGKGKRKGRRKGVVGEGRQKTLVEHSF